MELCHVLTITLRSQTLRDEGGAKDQDVEEEGGFTHATVIDRNKSHYTEAIKTGKLHDLLSCRHRADGKGVHMSVGDIPQKFVHNDKVPAFNTCWTAEFFWKRREVLILCSLCALTLTAMQSTSVADLLCMKNHQSNPKRSGDQRHPFPPLDCPDKESEEPRSELLHPKPL